MTNKLKILIVDDVDAQIKDIMACMLPHEGDLYADDVINLAKECFDFVTFKSVGEAIAYLENAKYRPDLAFCDLNFENLPPDNYPETERHAQKGVELIEWLKKHAPRTKIVLHTMYVGDDVDIIRQYSGIVFPIHRTFNDFKAGIQKILREIAQKYCQKISRDPKKVVHINKLMESAMTTNDFLANDIEIGSEKYMLKYILIGWARACHEDVPVLDFPDLNILRDVIKSFLTLENTADFGGNLRNDNVLRIINTYLTHPNHDEWCDKIRADALPILKQAIERWDSDSVKNPTLENPILKTLSRKLDSIVNGNSNLDGITVETFLRLLICRLVVISLHYLKNVNKGKGYFKTVSAKHIIDFSILAILKNDVNNFKKQVECCQNTLKKGQKPNVHASVKQMFTTKLGLRGDLTDVQDIDVTSLLLEEKEWLKTLEKQLTHNVGTV